MQKQKFDTFDAFYSYYLSLHSKTGTKVVHFGGTVIAILSFVVALLRTNPWVFIAAVIFAYAIIWMSHFFIEKNTPETWRHPWWSFLADLRMFFELLTGKRKF